MDTLTAQPPQSPSTVPDGQPAATPAPKVSTAALVATMLQVSKQISDLIFSPGRRSAGGAFRPAERSEYRRSRQATAGGNPADCARSDWKESISRRKTGKGGIRPTFPIACQESHGFE